MLAEFPSGLTLVIASSTVNEQGLPDEIRGRQATLYFSTSQNKVDLKPERPFADELDPESFNDPMSVGEPFPGWKRTSSIASAAAKRPSATSTSRSASSPRWAWPKWPSARA